MIHQEPLEESRDDEGAHRLAFLRYWSLH